MMTCYHGFGARIGTHSGGVPRTRKGTRRIGDEWARRSFCGEDNLVSSLNRCAQRRKGRARTRAPPESPPLPLLIDAPALVATPTSSHLPGPYATDPEAREDENHAIACSLAIARRQCAQRRRQVEERWAPPRVRLSRVRPARVVEIEAPDAVVLSTVGPAGRGWMAISYGVASRGSHRRHDVCLVSGTGERACGCLRCL